MPDMVSLKEKPIEPRTEVDTSPPEFFPSLFFDERQTSALGLADSKPGKEMVMMAKIRVASVNARKTKDGGVKTTASIDVIEAAIEKPSEKDVAEKLFGSD